METKAWYKGVSPNFRVNKYMWVESHYYDNNGNIALSYSARVDKEGKFTKFAENKETTIAVESSIRLCTADEIAEIKQLSGMPTINNNYSIF